MKDFFFMNSGNYANDVELLFTHQIERRSYAEQHPNEAIAQRRAQGSFQHVFTEKPGQPPETGHYQHAKSKFKQAQKHHDDTLKQLQGTQENLNKLSDNKSDLQERYTQTLKSNSNDTGAIEQEIRENSQQTEILNMRKTSLDQIKKEAEQALSTWEQITNTIKFQIAKQQAQQQSEEEKQFYLKTLVTLKESQKRLKAISRLGSASIHSQPHYPWGPWARKQIEEQLFSELPDISDMLAEQAKRFEEALNKPIK